MKKFQHFFIVACGLFSLLSTSCDNEYDLTKDINTDINVGKNFTLPVGQTVQIPVSRIIKVGENITTNTENIYELHAEGGFSSHLTDIEPYEINGMFPNFTDFHYDNLPQSDLINQDITINVHSTATYDLEDTKTELPDEVDAVYFAEFNSGKGAYSHLTICIPNLTNGSLTGISEITLNNVIITFPDIFILEDGSHIIKRDKFVLNDNNKFTTQIPINILYLNIPVDQQSKYISEENGKKILSFHEKIQLTAESTIKLNPSLVSGKEITFTFDYEIVETTVTKMNGVVSPDITVEESLAINDIPDFIKDKSSVFEPNELIFDLSLTNPIGLSLETTLDIIPWDNSNNNAIGKPVTIELRGTDAIKPSSTTNYIISNTPRSVPTGYINIVAEDLTSLFTTIPDSYKINAHNFKADGTDCEGFILGRDYNQDGSYKVTVPFSFNNLSINYTDYVDNLLDDLADVADLTDKIILNVDAVSTIPVELEATVELYDSYGNILNEIKVTGTSANTVKINASKNGEETVTPITLTLEEAKGSTQFEQLEKLVYTIKATNPIGDNTVLKSTQYIMLKNGVAKIPNGITTEL